MVWSSLAMTRAGTRPRGLGTGPHADRAGHAPSTTGPHRRRRASGGRAGGRGTLDDLCPSWRSSSRYSQINRSIASHKMIARASQRVFAPRGVQVRLNSSLPVPPKIATPKSVQGPGGSSARMEEVVSFYKALPKGPTAVKKGPFTNPGNGKPLVIGIGALLLGAYTLDYMNHLRYHKNRAH
ncbi:unnamed protein product [Parajaminaea phylloscopi]